MKYRNLIVGMLFLLASGEALAVKYSPETNYALRCSGCHGPAGIGTEKGGIPNFQDFVGSFSTLESGRKYLMNVPGVVGSNLSNSEISEVMNYVMKKWGGESLPKTYQPFTEEEVNKLKQYDVGDVVAYRRKVAKELKEQGLPVAPYPWP
ncbi:cytochrome c [Thiomicrorhabdus sp. ZW0627]|uniref:c-type cytochrome n=1 Tax=Thiomicrorhabdus sp. ZW0627 TaxID=3039774 RepID=UPI00243706B6|nr:cytochrome c [Thiomicrorhabdus sp. ZW0627]MDG6774448.1 cytochrome c [Thiomicrorhabdus sp. ZW0627]